MSDEADRPLTRRERRLQDMAETGQLPVPADAPSAPPETTRTEPADAETVHIEISPFNEDGSLRTRRELRELREAALQAQRAAAGPDDTEGAETPGVDLSEPELATSTEAAEPVVAAVEAEAPVESEPSATDADADPDTAADSDAGAASTAPDSRLEETQPLSLEDLLSFQSELGQELNGAAVAPAPVASVKTGVADGAPEHSNQGVFDVEDASASTRSEAVDVETGGPATEASPASESESFGDEQLAASQDTPSPDSEVKGKAKKRNKNRAKAAPEPTGAPHEEPAAADVAPEPRSASKPGYSFPDIAPLEESVSVFDNPAQRSVSTPMPQSLNDEDGDFDEIISRAVAQEGATGSAGGAALILPSLPDTGELSGPLGETGELYITGSIDLPRSLGETGSHAPLHDPDASEVLEEFGFGAAGSASTNPIAPVSASRAVSAVGASQQSVVKQDTRDRSKLPVILITTGGGLVIVVGAILAVGFSNGWFG